jgi:hypothetical protein
MSDIADPPGTTYVVPVSVNRLAELPTTSW